MAVNRVLTEGGDLEAAREEATTALEEVRSWHDGRRD